MEPNYVASFFYKHDAPMERIAITNQQKQSTENRKLKTTNLFTAPHYPMFL